MWEWLGRGVAQLKSASVDEPKSHGQLGYCADWTSVLDGGFESPKPDARNRRFVEHAIATSALDCDGGQHALFVNRQPKKHITLNMLTSCGRGVSGVRMVQYPDSVRLDCQWRFR